MINECPICGEKMEMFSKGNCPSCGYRSIDDFVLFRTVSNPNRIDLYIRRFYSDVADKLEAGCQTTADDGGEYSYSYRKANKTGGQTSKQEREDTVGTVEYSSGSTPGDRVYADIVYITPQYPVFSTSDSVVHHFFCLCKTSSGDVVWIYITYAEYSEKFDSTLNKIFSKHNDYVVNEIHLDKPVRINGVVKTPSDVTDVPRAKMPALGGCYIIEVESIERSTYAGEYNYTHKHMNKAVGDKVYADIISIQPVWGIYNKSAVEYHHYVCRCATSSGDKVWVHMTYGEYAKKFDSSVEKSILPDFNAKEVHLDTPIIIYGTIKKTDEILSGLSSEIGSDYVIHVDSID